MNEPNDQWLEYTPDKTKIRYHRSYRKLKPKSLTYIGLILVPMIAGIDALIILVIKPTTRIICEITQQVLSTVISLPLIRIVPRTYLYNEIFIINFPGRYPSTAVSILTAIGSLTVLFLILARNKPIDPKYVWLTFIFFIMLVSALYFTFFSGYFPYNLEIFSELYIKTEIAIWVIIPIVLSLALLPFPIPEYKKVAAILLTLGYSVVFCLVRYMVFLYVLRQFSYLYMALMFFILGPFLDFIYIVGSYSLCIATASLKSSKDMELWNWLQ
ncbi:MAG: hypothetical protein ACM3SY_20925 [Candidatus Omnitrophota bacterium]